VSCTESLLKKEVPDGLHTPISPSVLISNLPGVQRILGTENTNNMTIIHPPRPPRQLPDYCFGPDGLQGEFRGSSKC
jgi:hypothetical protein